MNRLGVVRSRWGVCGVPKGLRVPCVALTAPEALLRGRYGGVRRTDARLASSAPTTSLACSGVTGRVPSLRRRR